MDKQSRNHHQVCGVLRRCMAAPASQELCDKTGRQGKQLQVLFH